MTRAPPAIAMAGIHSGSPCSPGAGGGERAGRWARRTLAGRRAYPATTRDAPDDVGATVYDVLGVNPSVEVRDRQNRPVQLNRGEVMRGLFGERPTSVG